MVAAIGAFRTEVAALMEDLPFVEAVELAEDEQCLLVTTASGTQHQVFLGNLFAETREADPERRTQLIQRFLSTLEPPPEVDGWTEAQEMLVPVIRMATFAAGIPAGQGPVTRAFAAMLSEALVLDLPDSMRYVDSSKLSEWGVSVDEALAAGQKHLAECISDADVEIFDAEARIWHVTRNDDYQASRLAVPGWLAAFADRVDGRPIAIVPERAQLFVAGDAKPEVVKRMAEMAQREFEASARSISPALYTVDDEGGVVAYVPPDGHAAAEVVWLGHKLLDVVVYGAQKQALEKQYEEEGVEVFVASYQAMRRAGGKLPVSYAIWSEGVPSLLPKADLLVLSSGPGGDDEDSWTAVLHWHTAMGMAGECLAPAPGLDPPRFKTLSWPEPELLERIKGCAIELDEA